MSAKIVNKVNKTSKLKIKKSELGEIKTETFKTNNFKTNTFKTNKVRTGKLETVVDNGEARRKSKSFSLLNKHINFKKERNKGSARKDFTKVFCCRCKKEFVLPFRPRRPEVFCDSCFSKKNSKKSFEKKF